MDKTDRNKQLYLENNFYEMADTFITKSADVNALQALLWAAISFCSIGGHINLIKEKAWWVLLAASGLCLILLVGNISLAPILLLVMV